MECRVPYSWINEKTSEFFGDHRKKWIPQEPLSRQIVRLIVTIATMAVAITVVVVIFKTRTDAYRTERYIRNDPPGRDLTPTILGKTSNGTVMQNLVCPCDHSTLSWSSFTRLYVLNQSDSPLRRYNIGDGANFCHTEWKPSTDANEYAYWGCPVLLRSVRLHQSTVIVLANLVDQLSLAGVIGQLFQKSTGDALSTYRLLLNLPTQDAHDQWYIIEALNYVLNLTAAQFLKNLSSSDEDYMGAYTDPGAKAPNGTLAIDVLKGSRAFGLQMDWMEFLRQCDPPYCDEEVQNSRSHRFLSAVALSGGAITVLLFLVRSILWPCILHVARWSDDDQEAASMEMQHL